MCGIGLTRSETLGSHRTSVVLFKISPRELNGGFETFPPEELSWKITKNASVVSQYLGAHCLLQLSFDSDGPSTIVSGDSPQYIRQAQQHLIAASLEMLQLAVGPSEFLPNLATGDFNTFPVSPGSANTISSTSNETAYNVAFDTDLPFFEHIARDEAKEREFAGYMRNMTPSEGVDRQHLLAGFPWKVIGKGGIILDVGGSTGSAAIMLAKAFPHLKFVVQDLPANAISGREAAANSLPADVASRLTFQAHDLIGPQPVRGADVYLLGIVLHDWPDDEAVKILRHIVAAMTKAESRLLIMDSVLPMRERFPVSVEPIIRVRDLTMMQAFNSKERELDDWKTLLAAADSRLQLVNVVQPFGSDMSVLEVVIDPTACDCSLPSASVS